MKHATDMMTDVERSIYACAYTSIYLQAYTAREGNEGVREPIGIEVAEAIAVADLCVRAHRYQQIDLDS
jgi:hypothetical protein